MVDERPPETPCQIVGHENISRLEGAGYVIVPKVPTDAMRWAGGSAMYDSAEDAEGVYKAMLAEVVSESVAQASAK